MDRTMSCYRYPKVLVPAWNRGCHDGGPPKRVLQNLNFFIFKTRPIKFLKGKMKFDKIWGYQNEGVPFKQGRQDLNFLTF